MNKAENHHEPDLDRNRQCDGSGWAEINPAGKETSACDSLAALD
jgi:hypothetical protein